MSNINEALNSARAVVVDFGMAADRTARSAGTGILWLRDGTARAFYDLYDPEKGGLDALVKFVPSSLRVIRCVAGLPLTTYDPAIKAFNAQKDYLYATKFIGTLGQIFDGSIIAKKEVRENHNTVQVIDKVKTAQNILLGIANFLDTGKYLQKQKIVAFQTLSNMATTIGNYRVYVGMKLDNGKVFAASSRIEDIPVIGNILSAPKEIFIIGALVIKLTNVDYKKVYKEWKTVDLLDLAGSTGKLVILVVNRVKLKSGKLFNDTALFIAIDFFTSAALFAKYIVDCNNSREKQYSPERKDIFK